MKSLQSLLLNNANLSFLQNGSLNTLMVLKTLHLHDNPLTCDCNLRWLLEWLNGTTNESGFKLELPSKMKCSYPAKLNGSVFLNQNISSFKCSCEECQKNMRCSGLKNFTCNCNNETVTDSCDVICQPQESASQKQCMSADGRCYCSQQTPSCQRNAVLQTIRERYTCICNKGYTGNEQECTDLNECLLENNRCYRNTTRCINTDGSYRCACRPGYTEQAANVNSCAVIKVNLTILVVKATVVKVLWEPEIKNASCMFAYAEVGVKSAEIAWLQTTPIDCASKSYVLEGLKADTLYKLKMVLVEGRSETDIKVELVSKTFKVESVVSDVSKSTGDLSSGSIVAIAVVCVLLPTCLALGICYALYRRKRRKHCNSLSRLTRQHENIAQNGVRYIPGEIQFSNVKEEVQQMKTICKESKKPFDEWEIPRERLVTGSRIGEGEFGLILEGMLRTADGDVKVAIKTLKDDATRFDHKDMLAELKVFKKVGRHQNIVSLMGACTSPDGPLFIVTEFVGGGDLLSYLRSSRRGQRSVYVNIDPPVSEKDLLKIALHVAKGMLHISQKELVHRDLAARNVLLSEDGTAKVCDFGLTRSLYSDGIYVKKTAGRLPLKWMAPESIEHLEFTSKSDVWSYGVLLWEMATFGGFPYPETPHSLLVNKLRSGYRLQKPFQCSEELFDMMSSCWQLDPELRPTFEDICGSIENRLTDSVGSYVNLDCEGMFEYVEFEPQDIQDS